VAEPVKARSCSFVGTHDSRICRPQGGERRRTWHRRGVVQGGVRNATTKPACPESRVQREERERGGGGKERLAYLSGSLTCGAHVGPTLTQPPRRIKPGSKPPRDLVCTGFVSCGMRCIWFCG
jgi:hypothetical protein